MIITVVNNASKYKAFGKNEGHTDEGQTYYDYLLAFVMSASTNCPNIPLVVYAIDSAVEEVIKLHSNCSVYNVNNNTAISQNNYGVCYCTRALSAMLPKSDNGAMMIDVDTIIRKNVINLFKFPKGNEFKVMCRPHARDKSEVQAGVVIAQNTPIVNEFVSKWDEGTWRALALNDAWYHDQHCLSHTIKKYGERVNIIPLEHYYNDWHFLPESSIWHCKGHNDSPVWQEEYQRYLAMALEGIK